VPTSAPFTSPLAEELAPPLLERFCRYVTIDTQSSRDANGSPSTPGQLVLGRLLVDELHAIGLADAALDDNGYVTASLQTTMDAGEEASAVGLLAHLDTSPDAPGSGVEAVVHRAYDGGVIRLPRSDTRLDPSSMPELTGKVGHDLITSSGDTLLGADDKAGIAAVMSAIAYLAAHPELPRPELRIAFTPDEEIGSGAALLDLDRFGASCAYTIDGSDLGELQDETFSAVEAIITITGVDVHPGQANGKMVNALRLAARMLAALPSDTLAPEVTGGREGFIHPYSLSGSPAQAQLRLIVRDFDDELLASHVALLERTAHEVVDSEPRANLVIALHEQYLNMRRYIEPKPRVVEAAAEAMRAEGIEPLRRPIRGGTDGSRLSERGLPTPNIFDGGHEYHSVREWASLQDMAAAAATLVRLAEIWATPAAATQRA
jgi:tripeptide aminopeptidase